MPDLGETGANAYVVRFSADGRFALTGSDDGTIRAWDVRSGACLYVLQGHKEGVVDLALSSDGGLLLSRGRLEVRLWDLDWDLAAQEPADWDDGAAPHLAAFLALHRSGWTAGDFEHLLTRLQDVGYGWLRADGVRTRLNQMADTTTAHKKM